MRGEKPSGQEVAVGDKESTPCKRWSEVRETRVNLLSGGSFLLPKPYAKDGQGLDGKILEVGIRWHSLSLAVDNAR